MNYCNCPNCQTVNCPAATADEAQAQALVRSSELVGRCVEVGDDDEGQPHLIIHTTREQLKNFGRNLAYVNVVVTIAPPNDLKLSDGGAWRGSCVVGRRKRQRT